MSCATRITEDPYIYTEPVTSSTNHLYSSHISINKKSVVKHQQIRNSPQAVQNKTTTQKLTRIVPPNNKLVAHTTQQRINGQGPKPVMTQFLAPPTPATQQLQQQKTLHQVTSKTPANFSGPPTTANKYLKTINTQKHILVGGIQSSSSSAANHYVVAHQLHNNKTIINTNNKKPTIINHSDNITPNSSESSTTYSLQSQQQQQTPTQPQIRAIQYYNGPAKSIPIGKQPTNTGPSSVVATTSTIKVPPSKRLKQDLPTVAPLDVAKSSRIDVQELQSMQVQQTQFSTDWETVVDTSSKTFIIPKVQAKSSRTVSPSDLTTADSIKKTKAGKYVTNKKTKRSHSNAAYHETLQRIPALGKKRASSLLATAPSTPLISVISSSKFAIKNKEWHAPNSYIFDYKSPGHSTRFADSLELAGNHQEYWFNEALRDTAPPEQLFQEQQPKGSTSAPSIQYSINLSRDQRLDLKKSNLRRHAVQCMKSQRLRNTQGAKHRLQCVVSVCNKMQLQKEGTQQKPTKCTIPSCSNVSLTMATFCFNHIMNNKDQRLFQLCTAKFSDNSQCNTPVFDISHELPLCPEHAWKRDNYNRIIQEQKPKKPPRKKSKPSAMTRPSKKNRKKKKAATLAKQLLLQQQQQHQQQQQQVFVQTISPVKLQPPQTIQKPVINNSVQQPGVASTKPSTTTSNDVNNFHSDFSNFVNRPSNNPASVDGSQVAQPQKEYLTLCDNSSAYESSEDTGVGGLSETEFIGHDGDIGHIIEEIPFEMDDHHQDGPFIEEHELTNVLNHIEISEIFSDQNSTYEPTQEEQADLELALEAVDEQLKRMSSADAATDFLGEFLANVDDLCSSVVHTNPTSNSELIHT